MVMNSSSTFTSCNVFEIGNHTTSFIKVEPKFAIEIIIQIVQRPLLICTPSGKGVYPVLLLIHGYLLYNSFYSQLIQLIASHGFIVVAPQLCSVAGPDATEEIKITAEITNWLSEELIRLLPLMLSQT